MFLVCNLNCSSIDLILVITHCRDDKNKVAGQVIVLSELEMPAKVKTDHLRDGHVCILTILHHLVRVTTLAKLVNRLFFLVRKTSHFTCQI